jgi:hypothetical protein
MNKKYLALTGFAVIAVVGAVYLSLSSNKPLLGGDFAGGILPSQLFTANTATNGITPIGNLSIGFGGTAAANLIPVLYTATTAYPAATVTLGPLVSSTSTTSTVLSFIAPGFSVGDGCEVAYNGTTSTLPFGADAFVTAVNGNSVSTTATIWNGAGSIITLTPTSSATGVSSTLKVTCFHTGV